MRLNNYNRWYRQTDAQTDIDIYIKYPDTDAEIYIQIDRHADIWNDKQIKGGMA